MTDKLEEFKVTAWIHSSGNFRPSVRRIEEFREWCTESFGFGNYAIYWDEPTDALSGYRCDFMYEEDFLAFKLRFGL